MRSRRLVAPVVSLALLCASAATSGAATARSGNIVMGTILEVTVVADDQEVADQLLAAAFETARHWDDVLTTWRPEGELARLNASGGSIFEASKDLMRAYRLMARLSFNTRGAFDPGVGPIVERLRRGEPDPGPGEVESRDIYRIRTAAGVISGGLRLRHGAALDSGGIGKGIALDAIVGSFGRRAKAFYLDFGGSSQTALGNPETGAAAWNVVVAGNSPGKIHGTVALDGKSISTSRSLAADDPAGAIVDPTTLQPVKPGRLATVIADNAATAEAWSTALVVLGTRGIEMSKGAKIEILLEIDGVVTKTPGFPLELPDAKRAETISP